MWGGEIDPFQYLIERVLLKLHHGGYLAFVYVPWIISLMWSAFNIAVTISGFVIWRRMWKRSQGEKIDREMENQDYTALVPCSRCSAESVKRTVRSLINQTHKPKEVLVLTNGITAKQKKRITRIGAVHKNVRVIEVKQIGCINDKSCALTAENCDRDNKEVLCIEESVMSMAEFVEYWNEMSGFTSLLLSIVSIILVIISIVLSLYTARMQYAQKFTVVNDALDMNEDDSCQYQVWLFNYGNAPVYIREIEVFVKRFPFHKKLLGCLIYPTDEYKWIQQGEVVNGLVKIEKISEFYEDGKIICEIRYGVKGKKQHKRPIAYG